MPPDEDGEAQKWAFFWVLDVKCSAFLLPEPRSSLTEKQQLQPRSGGHLRDEEPGQPHDQDVPSTVLI